MLLRIEKLLREHWWFFFMLLLLFVFYRIAVQKKENEITCLTNRIHELQGEREKKTQEKEDLLSRIEAENDPAWIEQVLKKEIGVVPEGQMKVHFSKEEKK